jgi:hypothetical protein
MNLRAIAYHLVGDVLVVAATFATAWLVVLGATLWWLGGPPGLFSTATLIVLVAPLVVAALAANVAGSMVAKRRGRWLLREVLSVAKDHPAAAAFQETLAGYGVRFCLHCGDLSLRLWNRAECRKCGRPLAAPVEARVPSAALRNPEPAPIRSRDVIDL